jgi:nicotinamidase-related amidase
VCCESTARDAMMLDYKVIMSLGALASFRFNRLFTLAVDDRCRMLSAWNTAE